MIQFPWFKRIGILFIPQTIVAWLILLVFVSYAIFVFVVVDRMSHSVSDTLINFVLHLIIIAAGYSVIGYLTSKRSKA